MFIGEYTHTIDDKGRLSMPSKFRQQLSAGVVVTRGLDGCLFVYPHSTWEGVAEKLAALPISQKQSRAFARLMLAGAWDVKLDTQGRIMLPEYLRKYAKMDKHAVVAGLYNRLEIWGEDAWHSFRRDAESNSDTIAESMAELGI